MKFWIIILIVVVNSGVEAQDSIQYRFSEYKVFLEGEMLRDLNFNENYGRSLRIGGTYEKQILERAGLLIQLGIRRKLLDRNNWSHNSIENSDTTYILDKFNDSGMSNRIMAGLGFKFYYQDVEREKLSLNMGLRFLPEYILSNKIKSNYLESRFHGNFDNFYGVRNNYTKPRIHDSKVTGNVEISIGLNYKKLSIDFFFRQSFRHEVSRNVGFMIAYQLKRIVKAKE